ncbi:MAG: hypothetical protein RIT27_1502 [Pseudomonadota bacterium]|jgi:nitrogen fixation protein NifX
MKTPEISRDIALRIALASRILPETDAARLLKVLADVVGLPPTEEKLQSLKIKDLKHAADNEFAAVDKEHLVHALKVLKGEAIEKTEDLPVPESYQNGEWADSIRVACASNQGELLDGHFGSCERFLVYQVNPQFVKLIDVRNATSPPAEEEKNVYRTDLIKDCQVLFVASIGGPAAAKVIKAGIHPIKHLEGGSARARVSALQPILAESPPPWLAKIMGINAEQRVRFAQTVDED